MAGSSLGTIRGQIRLDVGNAIAAYAAVRAANAQTVGTMQDASRRMRGFGQAAVGMGALFLTGFGMAVAAAADFEKKLDYFGAVNNATAKQMEKVRAKALQLGRDTHLSATQVADALVEMGKAGISVEDILGGMADAMVNVAAAADIDMATATKLVTGILQQFNLTAKDAVHVTNLMAGAANASIIDIQDVGVSMKYVGGVANALGLSLDSTTTAISLLGKAGIKGSTAGTSLRQILVSLGGATKKAYLQLKDLNIILDDGTNLFFDQHGAVKPLGEVFQILQDHTAGLTQKQRLMALKTIFQNRALASAAILTKEGAAGFKEMYKEMSKTTAADVAHKRLDNLAGDIEILKGNLQTMLIEGGTPFQEFLRKIVQGLTQLVQWFNNLPRGIQTSIFAFMAIAGVIFVVAGAIAIFGGAILGAIGVVRSVMGAFRALTAILRILTAATIRMTIAALMNPYVLIAMAVIALIAGLVILYQKSEKFREIMDAIGRGIKKGFLATVEWFKGLPKFFSDLWDDIVSLFKQGVEWVKQNWDILLTVITGPLGLIVLIIRRFGDDIWNFLTSLPGKIASFAVNAFNSFLSFLKNLPYMVGFVLGFVIGKITKWSVSMATTAYRTGKKFIMAIVDWFVKLPGRVMKWATDTALKMGKWGIEMWNTGKRTGKNVITGIVDWFIKLPGRVARWALRTKDRAIQIFRDLVTGSIRRARDAYNGIVNWFRKLPERIAMYAYRMYDRARDQFNNLVRKAKDIGRRVYNGIVDWFRKLPGKAWDAVNNVIQAFKDMVWSAYNTAKDFAKGLWDGFKSGLGIASPSYIEKAMWAITKVTGEESARLKRQVRNMQGLSRGLQHVHDTTRGMGLKPDWMTDMLASDQNAYLAAKALFAPQAAVASDASRMHDRAASSSGLEAPGDLRPIHVEVHNPVAERASDSTARKLRTLSALGAF